MSSSSDPAQAPQGLPQAAPDRPLAVGPGPFGAPGGPAGQGGYGVPYPVEPQGVPRWGMGDVGIGFLLYLGAQIVAGLVLVVVLVATGQIDEATNTDDVTDEIGLLSVLVSVPLAWVVLFGWPWIVSKRKGHGRLSIDFGWAFRWVDVLIGLGGGFAALVASAVFGITYNLVFDSEPPTNTDIIPSEDVSFVVMALVFFVIAVGTPIAEEMFFRGLVMGAIRKRWGTVVATIASSLVFGFAHVQPGLTAWAFVGAVTATYGVVFALMRVFTNGRIAASIIAHMAVNATGVIVVFSGI